MCAAFWIQFLVRLWLPKSSGFRQMSLIHESKLSLQQWGDNNRILALPAALWLRNTVTQMLDPAALVGQLPWQLRCCWGMPCAGVPAESSGSLVFRVALEYCRRQSPLPVLLPMFTIITLGEMCKWCWQVSGKEKRKQIFVLRLWFQGFIKWF